MSGLLRVVDTYLQPGIWLVAVEFEVNLPMTRSEYLLWR